MKDKQTDLAAGRLGLTPAAESGLLPRPRKMPGYGVDRLGLASVEKVRTPPQPPSNPPPAVQGRAESPMPIPVEPAAPAPTVTWTPIRPRRWLKPVLCVCGLALLAGAVRLAMWCFAPAGDAVPRPASASVHAAAVAKETPPPAAPSPADPVGRDTAMQALARTSGADPRPSNLAETARGQPPLAAMEPDPLSMLNEWESPAEMAPPDAGAILAAPIEEIPKPVPPPSPAPAAPARAATPVKPQPTQTVGYKVAPAGIVVSAILHGPNGPLAMINNQSVTVGQTVGQAKVTRIDEFAVEMEEDGQRFLVSLSSGVRDPEKSAVDEDNAPPAPKLEPRRKPADEGAAPASRPPKFDPRKAGSRKRAADPNE